jgi:hypothetical protein
MKLSRSIIAVAASCVGMTACENDTKFRENMLASAGFKPVPPTTAAQVASLQKLPPHKLTRTTTPKGKTIWVYSDPTLCGCLYVGNQAAYDAYQRKQTQRAQLDMMTITTPISDWDVSPWPEAAVEP